MIIKEKISKGDIRMSKLSRIVLFAVTFLTFIISVKLFWNMGVYVDEAGTSPYKVCGGDFWLYMDWLRTRFVAVISGCTWTGFDCCFCLLFRQSLSRTYLRSKGRLL